MASNSQKSHENTDSLLQKIRNLNQSLVKKEQDLISVRLQLQTLENNINAQVDEFLKSLSVTNLNLQARFLEVHSNNQELRNIKDYIINSNIQSNSLSLANICQQLNVKTLDDIYEIDVDDKKESEAGNQMIKQKDNREEDKFMSYDEDEVKVTDFTHKKANTSFPSIEKEQALEDFEDDDFKFQFNKKPENKFMLPQKPAMDRIRAASSSVLENSMDPQFLNFNQPNKRFKQSETQECVRVNNNPNLPTFGMPQQPPSLPFLPNLQIDPEIICQMLIRKLAANSGLSNLNEI